MNAADGISYAGFLAREALFWAAAGGLLLGLSSGFSLSALVRSAGPGRSPRRVRSRRLTIATLMLTGAVLAGTFGVLFPSGLAIISADAAIAAGSGFGVGLLVGLFPAAVGLPLLVLAGVLAILGASLVAGLTPVRGETTLAQVQVLTIRAAGLTVELTDPVEDSGLPDVVALDEPALTAEVTILDLPRGLFVFGASRFAFASVDPRDAGYTPSRALAAAIERGWLSLDEQTIRESGLNLLQRYELRVGPTADPRFTRSPG